MLKTSLDDQNLIGKVVVYDGLPVKVTKITKNDIEGKLFLSRSTRTQLLEKVLMRREGFITYDLKEAEKVFSQHLQNMQGVAV